MGGPKKPKPPPPPAPPPTETSADVTMANEEFKKNAGLRAGRKSTILTQTVNSGEKNTLLG